MAVTAASSRQDLAVRPLLAVASVKLLVWAAVGGRYGFHRDELYYLVGGRHLELGYVDHPLLVPWLAHLVESLFGLSLAPLRLVSALASGAVVVLVGVIAARLGGGRRAQLLAAAAVLLCPIFLMTQNMFQTVPFDQLAWALACLVLVRLLETDDSRWWLAFGTAAGLGLLTKYTILALGAAVVLALLLTPKRRELVRPWIWAGGGVAFGLGLPSLVWQIRHGWPTLEFMANNRAAETFPPHAFLSLQAIFAGPFAMPLLVAGFLFYFSRRGERFRLLGWTAALVYLIFLASQSKPYYVAPIFPLLFAGGAVWLEARLDRAVGWRRHWPAWLLAGNLLLVPVFLPILPVSTYARLHDNFPHPEFGEMFGWPELVETVGAAYQGLDESTRGEVTVLTTNYGTASALDLWGGSWGLPPAACGQNSYYFWSRPRALDPVLAVGFRPQWLEDDYDEVVELAIISNRAGVDNEEAGRSVLLARGARRGVDEIWESWRLFR